MRTQKEMRKAFWQYLKETNPALYTWGKRSKSQNVLQLGEVATCTNLIINREVSVAILPNCC